MRILAVAIALLFLCLPTYSQSPSKPSAKNTKKTITFFRQVGEPRIWVEADPGTSEGNLSAGSVVENTSKQWIRVVGKYAIYNTDGELKYNVMDQRLIPPYKKAVLRQDFIRASIDAKFQVTARYTLWPQKSQVRVLPDNIARVEKAVWVADDVSPERSHPCVYIKSKTDHDLRLNVTLRIYDKKGVLVREDISHEILLQPEVAQKVTSTNSYLVSEADCEPFTVQADLEKL